jgi:agarase
MVDVNLNMLHQVGDQDSLDRSRFITIHSNPDESDWDGDNFTSDLRDHFLNGYDVYTGRSTGGITWNLKNRAVEDPSRPGHVLPSNIQALGTNSRNTYSGRTWIHPYEDRHKLVLCAQFHPFWPDGTLTNKGWALSQADTQEEPFGTATGEYMGLYAKHFFGGNGPGPPYCIEIINEPLWELVTNGTTPPAQCFKFHNNVAAAIRQHVPDIPIGGYTAAFPDFDKDNFQRWHERDKLFFDMSGEYMDFISIHLYDFPVKGGKQLYRKGSNVEATFDMMEHYSRLTLGKVLPFEISEYGAQTHDYNKQPWSAYRDWLRLKSLTSLLLSYLERPHHMLMTVPFTVVKAEWGRSNGIPYGPRLMRQAFEANGESGDHWVFTELVLFYELWSDVKGKRVDTWSTDPDFLCDAYVNGNEAFIIVSNLEFGPRSVGLNTQWAGNNTLESVEVKHMHLKNNYPVVETTDFEEMPASITLGSEGAMVVKYTFTDPLEIPDTSSETKYYATTYLQEIHSHTDISFQMEDVSVQGEGEAVLRLGIGRDHGLSLSPDILFNDSMLIVPEDFRGDSQADRNNYFGVLEIPVPYDFLQTYNTLTVTFPDAGGYVSSVALQVFEQSAEPTRSEVPDIFNLHFTIYNKNDDTPIEGAEVYFEDQLFLSNEQGYVIIDSLRSGTYSYAVKAEEYEDVVRDSFVFQDNAHLDIAMEPLSYEVLMKIRESELGNPVPNAKVSVGTSYNYSDAEGEADFVLYKGSTNIRVEKEYFETYEEVYTMVSDTALEIDLLRLLADVKFRITDLETETRLKSATVTLNDTSIVSNTLGLATFKGLKVNTNYIYSVALDGYQDYQDDLLLKRDSTVNIGLLVGLDEAISGIENLKLWPVPLEGKLHVEWVQLEDENSILSISDLSGRTVAERSWMGVAGTNRTSLDVKDLDAGFYLFSIQMKSRTLSMKVLTY